MDRCRLGVSDRAFVSLVIVWQRESGSNRNKEVSNNNKKKQKNKTRGKMKEKGRKRCRTL